MSHTPDTTPQEVAVHQFGDGAAAVFELQGNLRDLVVKSLHTSYLTSGDYLPDAKAVSPQSMLSLAVGGAAVGGTALSAHLASSLFIATADPSTLMRIGNGVGSAVMGVKGIASQAPFMAVPSSLPVLAPMMAMQALSTAVTLQQFKQVDEKLDDIKHTLDEVIARAEATHIGELMTASAVVDEVYLTYESEGRFSQDMLVRLALAERDVRRLVARFSYLVQSQDPQKVTDLKDVEQANFDAYACMLASFLDLRLAYLRVGVDQQEHPRSTDLSRRHLSERLSEAINLWPTLLNRSERMLEVAKESKATLEAMSTPERLRKGSALERKVHVLDQAYVATLTHEKELLKGFSSLIQSAEKTHATLESPQLTEGQSPTLVYWKDETGEHSFSTNTLRIA